MQYRKHIEKEMRIFGVKMCPKVEKSAQEPRRFRWTSPEGGMAAPTPSVSRRPVYVGLLDVIQSRGIIFHEFKKNQEES